MDNYFLNISGSAFILILLIVSAILFSIFSYRVTVPQISNFLRLTLITLRSVALVFLIFVMFEPIATLIRGEERPPRLRVLLDNSISAGITDAKYNRKEQFLTAVNKSNFQALNKNNYDVAIFDNDIRIVDNFHTDSLQFDGQATNISLAVRSILKEERTAEYKAMLLVTDGAFNSGTNPLYDVEQMGVPVFVIPIGDTIEPRDIALKSLITNEIAYIDNPVLVNVNVQIKGYKEGNLKLKLLEDDQLVADKDISINEQLEYFSVSMDYTPKTEGIHKLKAVISSLDGEITTANNQISDYINVLKNKRVISIFSGSLSPDVSFLVQHLSLDKNIEIRKFFQKQGAEFYEKAPTKSDLEESELFVFVGFPISSTPDNVLIMIKEELAQRKPLLFIAGLNTDYKKLELIQNYLPFDVIVNRPQEFLVTADVRMEALASPLIRVTGSEKDISYWNNLPPIFKTETFVNPKASAEIIAYMKIGNSTVNEPLILAQSIQNRKTLAILGYGLYRWKLFGYASDVYKGPAVDVYASFLDNAIRWLSTDVEGKKFSVKTSKKRYVKNEVVEFIGYVYDDSFNPMDNASVVVKLHTPRKQIVDIALNSIGNGRYYAKYQALEEGDYYFNAEGFVSSESIGKDQGRFDVGDIALEYLNLRTNIELLRSIAEKSGGRLIYPENATEFLQELKNHPFFREQTVTIKTDIIIWNNPLLLVIAILAFGMEWYIRKKMGLL